MIIFVQSLKIANNYRRTSSSTYSENKYNGVYSLIPTSIYSPLNYGGNRSLKDFRTTPSLIKINLVELWQATQLNPTTMLKSTNDLITIKWGVYNFETLNTTEGYIVWTIRKHDLSKEITTLTQVSITPVGNEYVYEDSNIILYAKYQYSVFGEVTEGMDTVDKIAALPRDGECPSGEGAKMIKVSISE